MSTRTSDNLAVGQGQVKLLDNKGVDAQGNKHLTSKERFVKMDAASNQAKTNFGDIINKGVAAHANAKAKATAQNAAKNGVITKYEGAQIRNDKREAGIANQQVRVDDARKEFGQVKENAFRDGKITPEERNGIDTARNKWNDAKTTLNTLKTNDKIQDAKDHRTLHAPGAKIKNAIDNMTGNGRHVGNHTKPPTFEKPMRHCGTCGGGAQALASHSRVGHSRIGEAAVRTSITGNSERLGQNSRYAMDGGKLTRVNSQGIDRKGTDHLTRPERREQMKAGAEKAKFTETHAANRNAASEANKKLGETYQKALGDGVNSRFDKLDIADAHRGKNIADTQVKLDDAGRKLGYMEKNFASDGRVTLQERRQLGEQKQKIGGLESELGRLKNQDSRLDARDANIKGNFFNRIGNAIENAGGQPRPLSPGWQPMTCRPPMLHGSVFAGASASVSGSATVSTSSSFSVGFSAFGLSASVRF